MVKLFVLVPDFPAWFPFRVIPGKVYRVSVLFSVSFSASVET